jgi:hypothetical protein
MSPVSPTLNETNSLPLPQRGIFKLVRQFENILNKDLTAGND